MHYLPFHGNSFPGLGQAMRPAQGPGGFAQNGGMPFLEEHTAAFLLVIELPVIPADGQGMAEEVLQIGIHPVIDGMHH